MAGFIRVEKIALTIHNMGKSKKNLLVAQFVLLFSIAALGQSTADSSAIMLSKDPAKPAVQLSSSVYKINSWGVGIFSVVATAANLYAIPTIIHGKRDLTMAELESLNTLVPNDIDRWSLKQDPSKRSSFYKASDITLPTIIISAATLGFDKAIRKDWAKLLLMFYEMHAFTFAIYDFSPFGPAFQNRIRPVAYYDYFPLSERLGGNNRNSLYSGHVASAAASTFFMVKVYSDYHPEIGKKRFLLYGLASIPPLVEGYLRIRALAHFPSDVVVGFVIGAVCGVAIPEMHRKPKSMQIGLYSSGGSNGLSFNWKLGKKEKPLKMLPDVANYKPAY